MTVVYGRLGNWPAPDAQEMLTDAWTSFIGQSGAGIGLQATAAGDLNGDGLADLLIGDATNNAVYLLYGKKQLLRRGFAARWQHRREHPPAALACWPANRLQHRRGRGRQRRRLRRHPHRRHRRSRDAAYLLLGQADPVWQTDDIDQHAAAVIYTAGNATLATAVDLNGDFKDEFAVGLNNTLYLFAGSGTLAPRAGLALYLASSNVEGPLPAPTATPYHPRRPGRCGRR